MKKIAFMFLTITNHKQPKIWEMFFKGHESKYNIYYHPKSKVDVTQKLFKKCIIKNIAETKRMYILDANLALMKAAYEADNDNYKFILVTDSCIPIRTFDYIYDKLIMDNRSYIEWWKTHPFNDFANRYDIAVKETGFKFPHNKYKKHSAYFILNREYMKEIVDHKINNTKEYHFFVNLPAGDEHFLSLLSGKQENEPNIINYTVTGADWEYRDCIKEKDRQVFDYWHKAFNEKPNQFTNLLYDNYSESRSHPRFINKLTNLIFQNIIVADSFFYRKFDTDSNIMQFWDTLIDIKSNLKLPNHNKHIVRHRHRRQRHSPKRLKSKVRSKKRKKKKLFKKTK
jgi:hypothetical protein